MQQRFELYSEDLSSEQLHALLTDEITLEPSDMEIKLLNKDMAFRSSTVDPTVLVAIVSGVNVVLSTLIVGIFKIIENKSGSKGIIEIYGADGRSIKIPADTDEKKLLQYIEIVKTLDDPKITIKKLNANNN